MTIFQTKEDWDNYLQFFQDPNGNYPDIFPCALVSERWTTCWKTFSSSFMKTKSAAWYRKFLYREDVEQLTEAFKEK